MGLSSMSNVGHVKRASDTVTFHSALHLLDAGLPRSLKEACGELFPSDPGLAKLPELCMR